MDLRQHRGRASSTAPDVLVADGWTGNIALKTIGRDGVGPRVRSVTMSSPRRRQAG
jgi:fatty acid/phospholipid biosynthesis enzyme